MSFNAKEVKNKLVSWVREWFEVNGPGCNAVVGISGGKDSTVAAAICVEALGKDRVIGVMMPNGIQNDINDSKRVCEYLGIKNYTIDISWATVPILKTISHQCDFEISENTKINLPARIRMTTLYAIAQSTNGRVVNTCNLSEDWVGYSTRYGDSAGDFSPFGKLTTEEVIAIGEELGLPDDLIYKTPSDGLCGKSDEDNLGFTYKVLNKYIRTGVCEDSSVKEKIDYLHNKNLFKLELMPMFPYNG